MMKSQANMDSASIHDMIQLLKEYEKMCLDKHDFSSADQAKNKIDFLKTQQIILRKEKFQNQEKENIQNISKQGEEEVKNFQAHWDQQLKELLHALRNVQASLVDEQERQYAQAQERLKIQKPPRIKFSSQVLELRKYLSNLIKIKNYKQAEIVKNKLDERQREEQGKWEIKHEQKQKGKLQALKKKQQNELKALRVRMQGAFNEKIKERDHKFQILLKKNRKRRIQSGKVSRQRLKTKTTLLNESKSYMVSSKF